MRRRTALVLLATLALVACSKTRAPFVGGAGNGERAEKGTDAGTELYIPPLTPPGEDAGLCGRAVVPIVV